MTQPKPKSLMRNLGEFFGHIARGVKADPSKEAVQRQEVMREVEERQETGPEGHKITVRRTTVEEIEIRPAGAPNKQAGGHGS
ncbi:MAG: hypothetical protein IPJ41_00905 [Phycisphaerales bacterium]|nr:hypothetical protein [Phycisphaerales bacterium]